VSTTSAADLVSRADLLVRELRNTTDPVSLAEWERFVVTAYRLLHQLVGPGRADDERTAVRAHAQLVRVLQSYPTPLRPPVGATTYSTRQAAQFLGLAREGVLHRIHQGDIPATTDGRSYGIAATDLDRRTDLGPADPTDPHPLPRLSCTFGALADLLVADRDREVSMLHDDVQVAALMAHVLTLTAVAARHTMGHCRVTDADRPLRMAQFAERAVDALGTAGRLPGLDRITSCAPPGHPTILNERLEAALRTWANAGRDELNRTVPSIEVLRNIANQGRHIYAVTDRLLHAPGQHAAPRGGQSSQVSGALCEASEALRHADDQWAGVTTAMGPSHDYVATTRDLFAILREIGELDLTLSGPNPTEPTLDVAQALADLNIASRDLADLMHETRHLPEVLIRSELLFSAHRTLKPTVERLVDRAKGRRRRGHHGPAESRAPCTPGRRAVPPRRRASPRGAHSHRQLVSPMSPRTVIAWTRRAMVPPPTRSR
jgi:excisionase family DNA binding protein